VNKMTDEYCECAVCDRAFQNVEGFDRHRMRGRCRMPDMSSAQTATNANQDIATRMTS
jgi:hypothetical protein